jgi:hypothetical protein
MFPDAGVEVVFTGLVAVLDTVGVVGTGAGVTGVTGAGTVGVVGTTGAPGVKACTGVAADPPIVFVCVGARAPGGAPAFGFVDTALT